MVRIEKTASGLIITAGKERPWAMRPFYLGGLVLMHIGELWSYRELLRNMVVRDLKVRYRNSVLGVLWSLGNPLLMMVVFTVVFTVMTGYAGGES